ncbi:MAG: hypothetical protein ABI765_02100 [Gemmatimonadota bacterium]
MNPSTPPTGTMGRSTLAIIAGLIFTVVASLGIDELFHALKVYPPHGAPMPEPSLNLLALSYRLVVDTAGCYIAARLAPAQPMKHALILGGIGTVLGIAGVVVAVMMRLDPLWYPILLAASSMPTAWLGGYLFVRRAAV